MRALVIVLDGVGCGCAPDAEAYGDLGADTLGHLAELGLLEVPTLMSLGLGHAMGRGAGPARAAWGRMRERSAGKDSTTGHWEIAGVVLDEPFRVFDRFPASLVQAIEAEAGVAFLGNRPASGTQIMEELGPEHLRTGRPILYTSADSVLQVAAHEELFPPERLYDICRIARRHADAWRIGRVIARPFLGEPGRFARTPRRHDFSMAPPPTILDATATAGLPVHGVGKIEDLFAGQGITDSHPTRSNAEGMQMTERLWRQGGPGLVFTNLVDFDTEFGHRRDAPGFARALAEFDTWLAAFLPLCGPEDLVVLTADHGTDPTFRGTDHTREEVPLLALHGGLAGPLGTRDGFADVAATLAAHFGLARWPVGQPMLTPRAALPPAPPRPG
jgi:phosphopentomutase